MTAELASVNPVLRRKPRLVLMGEFSAGKSTLANLLMGEALSQVQATATQMPPVWYAQGDGPAVRIAMDGTEEPLGAAASNAVTIGNTRAIRRFAEADILETCDIIDMPGSSDPNITEDIWQRMLPLADAVIWCTPATQAWRQSEAALWEEAPARLFPRSLLLITRIDKVLSEADRQRVAGRVRREAGAMFRAVIPVSLLDAQDADADPEAWRASGLEAVLAALQEILAELEEVRAAIPQAAPPDLFGAAPDAGGGHRGGHGGGHGGVNEASALLRTGVADPALRTDKEEAEDGEAAPIARVVPRRVVVRPGGAAPGQRPRRAAFGSLI